MGRGGGQAIRPTRRRIEWPSVAFCLGVYGGFLVLTGFRRHVPTPLFVAAGTILLVLHASMQHEFIHGHPTPWRRLNQALGFVPLSIWLPFASYRMTHLLHHRDDNLTDPLDDPETYYWTHDGWAALGPLGRVLLTVHSTLLGRLLVGPAWAIGRYLVGQARAVWTGAPAARSIWFRHGLGAAAVLAWSVGVCGIDPLLYLFGLVYPATSLLLLRSFAEHRAELSVPGRTAIVENAPILGFLFLYNNLHAAHHERPLIPWYALPAWYRANRERLRAENGGLVYSGYADVARRFLLAPHHTPVHPFQGGLPRPVPALAIFRRLLSKNGSAAARSVS